MGRYRRPAIVPPFGNLRPAVVFAFPDEIELVAAARPHFMRPEVAGLVEGDAQQIAVPQRPYLRLDAALIVIGVGGRDHAGVRQADDLAQIRSEERRVGKECVSTCRSRWTPYH